MIKMKDEIAEQLRNDNSLRLEINKEHFVKTINGNMKTLNNLVNDYTTHTHDVIEKQLNSQPTRSSHIHVSQLSMSPIKDPKPSEVFSMNSVQSMPSKSKDGNGVVSRNGKDDVDDTEAFITHSDHLAKAEIKDGDTEKKFNQTGLQNTRL